MKNLIFIIKLLLFTSLFGEAYSVSTISMFNFKELIHNFIPQVPNGIVVEVPGILNKNGVTGIKLDNYPSSFGTLLNNQSGTIQLTTDAVLNKSKHSAYLAMLADPVVDNARSAEKLLDTIIEFQNEYLGYLK